MLRKSAGLVLVLVLAAALPCWAQFAGHAGTARQMGMGGAQVAIADDASSAASNPAGLARLRAYWTGAAADDGDVFLFGDDDRDEGDQNEVMATGGVQALPALGVARSPRAGVAFAGGGDDLDAGYGLTADVAGIGVTPSLVWSLGYGAQFGGTSKLSWGAGFSGVTQQARSLAEVRVGLLWCSEEPPARPDEGIALGITAGYNTQGLFSVRGGPAFHIGDSFVVAGDLTWIQNQAALGYNVGAEGEIGDHVALRVGTHNSLGTTGAVLCLGAGYKSDDDGWRVDIGWEYLNNATQGLMLSAGTTF